MGRLVSACALLPHWHNHYVAVTLVAGIGGPAAEAAGLVARPLPLGGMARVVAQLGCDRGLHQHVPLTVQSVPVVGGVNVLVDTAMWSCIHTYIQPPPLSGTLKPVAYA